MKKQILNSVLFILLLAFYPSLLGAQGESSAGSTAGQYSPDKSDTKGYFPVPAPTGRMPVVRPHVPTPMKNETQPGVPDSAETKNPAAQVPTTQVHIQVDIANDRLTLLAEDKTFGEVMSALAQKANFITNLTPDLNSTRISISLQDVPLDRAIIRLFSLVHEKNYSVKYGPNGQIMQVAVIKTKLGPTASAQENLTGRRFIQPQDQNANRLQRYRPQYRLPGEPPRTAAPQTLPPQPRYPQSPSPQVIPLQNPDVAQPEGGDAAEQEPGGPVPSE